jgi:hypothetical protein
MAAGTAERPAPGRTDHILNLRQQQKPPAALTYLGGVSEGVTSARRPGTGKQEAIASSRCQRTIQTGLKRVGPARLGRLAIGGGERATEPVGSRVAVSKPPAHHRPWRARRWRG